ncbi:MAG: hypothetical protein S4CHLAM6_06220 [Chlamydiae bacterium]|nr:hypothetical protein [Chlamydiota bacterium]
MTIAQLQINEKSLPQVVFTEKKMQRLKEQVYAPLEPKTLKILNRLKKRLNHLDKQITEARLEDSRLKIQHRIHRHSAQRVQINKKDFKLFSEGKDSAKMSRRVEGLRERLRNGFYVSALPTQNLKGRITKA